MKLRMGKLGWALVCAGSLLAACGGSSDGDGDGGGGGGAGQAGSAAGSKTAGSAGTSGSAGASAGNGNGGSAQGGTRTTGGTPSAAGTGLGGFNVGGEFDPGDFMCDPAPQVGSACVDGTTPCLNGTSVCYCQMSEWACMPISGGSGGSAGTGPIGNVECPAAKPMSGTPCGDAIGFCPYGDGQFEGCACYAGNWACL